MSLDTPQSSPPVPVVFFDRRELDALLALAEGGIRQLFDVQRGALDAHVHAG